MKAPTTTTPTSHERYYKGNNIGVDDAMIPLVDMMTCDDMHAMDDTFDVTYARFIFPCDALPLDNIHHMVHVDHVELFDCDDIAIDMPCYRTFTFPIVACNMMKNCSFKCFACNDETNVCSVVTNLMNNCSFPKFVHNNDISLDMLCYKCL